LRAAVAAGQVAALVCCAQSTKDAYRAVGMPPGLLHVIPNGVDLRRFRPDERARARLRAELGIAPDAPVIAFAARYDRMKNVPLFLAAAAHFLRSRPRAHLLMFGAGMTSGNAQLAGDLAVAGLDSCASVHLLGVRADTQALFAACDVVSLTSAFGEAAPLCLIEGMMCGAVPVATDVGDCAAIVAGHGLITPAEPAAVAGAWAEAIARRVELTPSLIASRARFTHTRMIAAYDGLIRRTVGSVRGGLSRTPAPAPVPA